MALKYEYDYFGVKKVDYPGSLRADDVYIYNYLDKTKQVRKELPANSYIVTEYDELNRVKSVTYLEGRSVKYYYDGVGRLLKTTETSSTQTTEIAYEYDLTGNVKKAIHTYNGNVYEVSYSYDEKGNVTGITYPGGYSVGYEYDAYGRVINVPQFVQGGGSIPGVKYKVNGFVEEVRYVNGITTAFTDDSLGRIQRISNPVFNLTYGYDGKGNITSITGSNGTAVASTYSYSDNGWLKEARQGQNVYSYIYDNAGNCTTKTINGVQTSYGYASNELNLLTSVNGNGVTYDKMGNMTGRNDIGCSYTYDQSNQLTEVLKNGQDVGRYYYNSEGKRYQKVENGESTYYVYSGESLLYELKPDGTKVYYIYLNGKQIAKVEGGKKYFYHTDHLGSTRAITDDQGNVVERFEYQPFGAEESTTGDTLTYTGKMQDDPTGLMYFNARYYDPTLGRFLSEDPAKYGFNWYVYCNNNPLRFIDINGKIATEIAQTWNGNFLIAYETKYVYYGRTMSSKFARERWDDYVFEKTGSIKFVPELIKYTADIGIAKFGLMSPEPITKVLFTTIATLDALSRIAQQAHASDLHRISSKLEKGFTLTMEIYSFEAWTPSINNSYSRIIDENVITYYITLTTSNGYEKIFITEEEFELLRGNSNGNEVKIY